MLVADPKSMAEPDSNLMLLDWSYLLYFNAKWKISSHTWPVHLAGAVTLEA